MQADPIERFHAVFDRATKSGIDLPDRVCLATVGKDGRPSARMVLLKAVDERGFVFYTNLESRKGRQLGENPYASLCFYWDTIGEQVRVDGPVSLISDEEADAYFATRDRLSQIGAWASDQSHEMKSPATLTRKFAKLGLEFGVGKVPRPPHWSGYRLAPDSIEFWKNKPHRLHERHLYTRDGAGWKVALLYP